MSVSRAQPEATARKILGRHGLSAVHASVEGGAGEVLVLAAGAAEERRLLEAARVRVVPELRAAGFRYIALDLGTPAAEGG